MNSEFRFHARTLQYGNFLRSFLVLIFSFVTVAVVYSLPFVIEMLVSFGGTVEFTVKLILAVIIALVSYFLIFSLSYGIKRYFLKCADGERKAFSNLLYFFKPSKVIDTARFSLCSGIANAAFAVICLTPSAMVLFGTLKMLENNTSLRVTSIAVCCFAAMLVIGLYFYFRVKRMLFLCGYLFAVEKSNSFLECVKISAKKMEKQTSQLFFTRFSFIGWIAACIFVLPIAYVWAYYNQTMAVAAKSIMMGEAEILQQIDEPPQN